MKISSKILSVLALGLVVLASAFKLSDEFSLGKKAPLADVKMKDISGKEYALKDLKKENGLLVVFSCNTCPFVIGWENRYNELYDLASKNKMGMVLINSNEAKRTGDDSMEEMKKHARELSYKMPYVIDAKNQLADAFGAKTTPHVYLLDKDLKLAYVGAIDDNMKDSKAVKSNYLKDAISNTAAGKKCEPAQTKAVGCSIKRAS